MVQLSFKVTFAHIWNSCKMHPDRERDVSEMRTRCVCASAKPHNKAAARLT